MDKSFTFHDGFTLPKGQRVIFTSLAIQMDPKNYRGPGAFDGYRFLKSLPNEKASSSVRASTVDATFLQ